MPGFTNQLVNETSPYLLQHAHNPVDWHPWSADILAKAKSVNKPVLVSIGYAACHWCHVMERESFENETTAAFMNEHFINIKIDREERPDLDHIYMDAVQAMTGSGGWPLNVFLTPEGKPFYGGTYFPPVQAFNRISWMDVLAGVSNAFNERRDEIEEQAENLTAHLSRSNDLMADPSKGNTFFNQGDIDELVANALQNGDTEWGGFGKAPKFPQTFTIRFLLRYVFASNRSPRTEAALAQAMLSLDKMIEGGIYDQLGGGFARYSTDTQWLAPHFEKMLYDNALLVTALAEAWQLTRKPRYREVIEETMSFVQRELLHPDGGFYAALDADSEGEEGKFYVWDKSEVDAVLGDDAALFCEYYDVSETGNWSEHPGKPRTNILHVPEPLAVFALKKGIPEAELGVVLAAAREKLLARREGRIRPGLDDKIILGWNAMMNSACTQAYAVTGNEHYLELAVRNMEFLVSRFSTGEKNQLHHTWKAGRARYPAFLDDYAYLTEALILLQEATMDTRWLEMAQGLVQFVLEEFTGDDEGLFYYTGRTQHDILLRKKEIYDGAVPSGNAIMVSNLWKLGILTDNAGWKSMAATILGSLGSMVIKYPGSFGVWSMVMLEMVAGTAEIAVVGPGAGSLKKEILTEYLPHRVLMATGQEREDFPLLAGKKTGLEGQVYLCKDFACLQPVTTTTAFMKLINSAKMVD
ncbi:MAG: thioredoxin domain-containing protein [Chitinophagaceae bacterium]|nr:MAG: thioredoxin domain-containing protein [Chitinophagaceae bacterium]